MNAGGEKDGGDAGAVDAGRCHGEGRARDSASAVLVQPHTRTAQDRAAQLFSGDEFG